jgi:hypothetical protein
MRYFLTFGTGVVVAGVLAAALGQSPSGQSAPITPSAPGKGPQVVDAPPSPPRASLADYQGHASIGAVTIAAEFTGHNVVTPLAAFTTEDYVAVDVGLFGQPDSHVRLSHEDFSLRINGKKALPAQQYLLMFKSLKDPEYVPPEPAKSKDDAGVPIVGQSPSDRNPQWHPVPFEVSHKMEVRVEKAALPEGDRALPADGLIFFPYKGSEKGITSVELLYDGPAGRTILTLHP